MVAASSVRPYRRGGVNLAGTVDTVRLMVTRIGARKPPRLFIAEWRSLRGLSQEALGNRLETTDVTISRWETGKRRPDLRAQAAIAHALDIELVDLFRHPDQPSADALLRGQPREVWDDAIKIIKAIRR